MSDKKKILLLNPPGTKIYIRDYYCSKVSKAYYYPQPVDLLIQSSFFDEEKYDLLVIDCIAGQLSSNAAIEKIQHFEPDFIIGLIGAVSLYEDVPFYSKLNELLPNTGILVSGDAVLEDYDNLFAQWKWMNVVIYNFFNDGALKWVEGDTQQANGIVYLENNVIVKKAEKRTAKLDLPIPKHHLFSEGNYRMPFANGFPMATVLTNYACPYPCTFCIMSTMPFMSRTAESIISELKLLKELDYRYIYFSDQTFFQSKAITKQVLQWMIETGFNISWMCFSRVDVLDKTEIDLMKRAGCNLIMFGVEFADNAYLEEYKKSYTLDQIRTTFSLTANAGIKRLGTFLIGVPGQTKQSIIETVEFAKEIKADYASFNVAVPRSNTSFREKAINAGIIDDSVKIMDQSGDVVTMGTGEISRDELQELKNWAYKSFYFRPGYILKLLLEIKNLTEFRVHVREGWSILAGILKKK